MRALNAKSFRGLGLAFLALVLSTPELVHAEGHSVDFGRDVLPILSDHCFRCHGPDAGTRKADLRLDQKEDALRSKDAVIVAGKAEESEVYLRIIADDPDEVMPPRSNGKPLSESQKQTIRRWIDQGAPWGKHWAFEPLRAPTTPDVRDPAWTRDTIDRYVLARLESEQLTPSPEADRTTLLRRLSLDLTGLPPTPREVDAFLSDTRPDAYERQVDRLLASPAYGERMAWDWLDAARYADSNGYQGDNERTMWPWRDWVVSAFNRNIPFDRFTLWQFAGDLLPNAPPEAKLATGFFRNHMINGEGGRIAEENRVDYVMDMTETAGTVWLGLTFNCCRCHDHKFDPLTQRDYYRLSAYFNQTPVTGGGGDPRTPPVMEAPTSSQTAQLERANETHRRAAAEVEERERSLFARPEGQPITASSKSEKLSEELRKDLTTPAVRRKPDALTRLEKAAKELDEGYANHLARLRASAEAVNSATNAIPRVMVLEDQAKVRDTFVLTRGSYEKPGEKVTFGVPSSLHVLPTDAPTNRLGLARWITSRENPLTARVVVNRFWQQVFGVGLVKTAEDFGVQGERPSNPALLDALAWDFVASGWDTKALMRRLVTSATYRQSSKVSQNLAERDPDNRLLARGPRYRLPSWMIRDQALAVSGLMVRRDGGQPVKPYQPSGVWEDATFGRKTYQPDSGEALYRRSLYTFWRRIVGPTMFFDSAPRQTCVVKPTRTNSPMHALTTLNDVTYVEAARALAQGVLLEPHATDQARIERAFRRVLSRSPKPGELDVLASSLARVKREFEANPASAKAYLAVGASPRDDRLDPEEHAAFSALCLAILNLDETLTKE